MKNIEKIRDQVNAEAIAFLRKGLYAENQDNCPDCLYVCITTYNKEKDLETYEEELKIFKALFNAGNVNYKIALWNRLILYYSESTKFYRKDFSRDEFAFIKAALKATGTPIYEANVNEPIVTDKLILRAIEKSDYKHFAYHYKNDGDFDIYCGLAPTNENVKRFAERRLSTLFAIEEKSSHALMGYVGLSIKPESSTGLLEYYIFKEHRKRGYCKEAVNALVNAAMTGNLYEPRETLRYYVYQKKVVKLNAIRARISVANTASLNTVKSCGFIYEATIHKTIHKQDFGWTDEEIYYIPMEAQ